MTFNRSWHFSHQKQKIKRWSWWTSWRNWISLLVLIAFQKAKTSRIVTTWLIMTFTGILFASCNDLAGSIGSAHLILRSNWSTTGRISLWMSTLTLKSASKIECISWTWWVPEKTTFWQPRAVMLPTGRISWSDCRRRLSSLKMSKLAYQ